jgi:hypothetical protein
MDDGGGLIAGVISLCLGLPFLAIFLYSVFWAYNDAEKRGKSGCLVALLVFLLTWPVGLIIWLLIRPPDNKYY